MPRRPPFPGSKGTGSAARPGIRRRQHHGRDEHLACRNLTDDPEFHRSPGGTARATFRVAVSARVRDGEGWRDGEPAFHSVVVWRDQAEHAAESLAKGSWVVVVGGWRSGPGRPTSWR
jgi:hypothetical protein